MNERIRTKRSITLAGIVIVAMLVIALPAAAKTWHVDDNGQEYPDADHTRIGDAINESRDGDMIKVYAGTYNERLKIEKRLTLEGVGQPVIDAEKVHSRHAVSIRVSDVVLRGFKITNTGSTAAGVHILGLVGGTRVDRMAIIEDNLIDGCYEGIWFDYGEKNTIRRNTISNTSSWGGIFGISSKNAIYLNTFVSNKHHAVPHSENTWNSPVVTYTYKGNTFKGVLGNYWDDYDGNDGNGDGIGDDARYAIDGSTIYDDYPLMEPFENYDVEESGYPMIGDINGDGTTGVAGAMQDAMHLLKYSYNDPGYPELYPGL